jgi:hyperosmotically inducible periplasmic protein
MAPAAVTVKRWVRPRATLGGLGVLALVLLPGVAAAEPRDRPGADGPTAGPGSSPARSARSVIRDSWLTAKVKIALFADERVKSTQISVDTVERMVTLRGKVDSEEARAAAVGVARRVDGVGRVQSALEVAPPPERARVDAADKDITRRVEGGLARDRALRSVEVRTDRQLVTLTGEAPSIQDSARASEIARGVGGVRAVRNEIQTDSGDRRGGIVALLLLAAAGRKAPVLSGREPSAPSPGAQERE